MSHAQNGTSAERQEWLERATLELRSRFSAVEHEVPSNVRVSIGWPRGGRGNTIGQCWYPAASSDTHHEVFISPRLGDSLVILSTLAHELAHTVAGPAAKHGAGFKRVAVAIGLEGKMTATTAGEAFRAWAAGQIETLGQYPAGSLDDSATRTKQSTRLMKAECGDCGYTVRVTKKWLDESGAPLCPCNHDPMRTDSGEGDDE